MTAVDETQRRHHRRIDDGCEGFRVVTNLRPRFAVVDDAGRPDLLIGHRGLTSKRPIRVPNRSIWPTPAPGKEVGGKAGVAQSVGPRPKFYE